jgi:hypothetical protein
VKKVKLETAFMWRCPDCRHRNFAAAVARELTMEERDGLIGRYGPLEESEFELVGAPEFVTCGGCSTKFKTYDEDDFS